jgi:hypothetical protein
LELPGVPGPNGGSHEWLQAVLAGVGFIVAMIAVEWPVGSFLVSPLAQNRLFGTEYYTYTQHPNDKHFKHEMRLYDKTRAQFLRGMTVAFVAAILTTRVGLWGSC